MVCVVVAACGPGGDEEQGEDLEPATFALRPVLGTPPSRCGDGALPSSDDAHFCFAVADAIVTEADVASAQAVHDDGSAWWAVEVELRESARSRWESALLEHTFGQVAVVVDGGVVAAPIVNPGIIGLTVVIAGNWDEAQARRIAARLASPPGYVPEPARDAPPDPYVDVHPGTLTSDWTRAATVFLGHETFGVLARAGEGSRVCVRVERRVPPGLGIGAACGDAGPAGDVLAFVQAADVGLGHVLVVGYARPELTRVEVRAGRRLLEVVTVARQTAVVLLPREEFETVTELRGFVGEQLVTSHWCHEYPGWGCM